MIFGKIDYINLLPFHIFLKKLRIYNAFKQSLHYKSGVPSKLNGDLKARRVDAAVISSIKSQRKSYKKLDMGIVAKRHVWSVLAKKNTKSKDDIASASSNALAKVLGVKGEVVIGDRALRLYLKEPQDYEDLAKAWNEKYALPFVFARFCVNKNENFYRNLIQNFLRQKIKIPRYILEYYSKTRQIPQNDILEYLKLISYEIGYKEKKALKLFLKSSKPFFKP